LPLRVPIKPELGVKLKRSYERKTNTGSKIKPKTRKKNTGHSAVSLVVLVSNYHFY